MLILAGVYDISMTLNDGVNDEVKDDVKDEVKDKACAMAGAGQGQAGEGQVGEPSTDIKVSNKRHQAVTTSPCNGGF